MPSTSNEPASTEPARTDVPPRTRGKLRALLLCGTAVLALAAVAITLLRAPRAVAPTAATGRPALAQPDDTATHLQQAAAEEERGYRMAALAELRAARRLGATEGETAGRIGRCLLRLRRLPEARRELEKALKADPRNVESVVGLAWLDTVTGAPAKAEQRLTAFVQRYGADVVQTEAAAQKLATAFTIAGAHEGALKLARQMMEAAPNDPGGYLIAGRELLALKKPDEAVDVLEAGVEIGPNVAPLRFLFGNALFLNSNRSEAALMQWQEASRLDEQAADAFYALGRGYARQKEWRKAAIAYLTATSRGGAGPATYARAAELCALAGMTTEAAYCRAQSANLAFDHATALREFLAISRQTDPFWRGRGLDGAGKCYLALRQVPQYLAAVEKSTGAGKAEDWLRIADAYGLLQDPREAAALAKALALDPSVAGRVHRGLARRAEAESRFDDAEREYAAAISADSSASEAHRALARLYLKRKDVGERSRLAAQEAGKAAELDPDDSATFHLLGMAWAAAGDLKQAEEALQHAIDLDPDDSAAYLDLGTLLMRNGERERGEELLRLYRERAAIDLKKRDLSTRAQAQSGNPAALIAFGEFLFSTRDYAGATEQLQRALLLTPGDKAIRRKLAEAYRRLDHTGESEEQLRLIGEAPGTSGR